MKIVDEKSNCCNELSKDITNVLQQFENVMSPQLLKKLSQGGL